MIAEEYLVDILDLNRCDPKFKFVEKFSFGHCNNVDKLIMSEKSGSLREDRYLMEKKSSWILCSDK
jgi:hypothetical protein